MFDNRILIVASYDPSSTTALEQYWLTIYIQFLLLGIDWFLYIGPIL